MKLAGGRSLPLLLGEGAEERHELLAQHFALAQDGTWRLNNIEQYIRTTGTVRDSLMIQIGDFALVHDTVVFDRIYPGYGNPFPREFYMFARLHGDSLIAEQGILLWVWLRRR